jgi:hypothetical protein
MGSTLASARCQQNKEHQEYRDNAEHEPDPIWPSGALIARPLVFIHRNA